MTDKTLRRKLLRMTFWTGIAFIGLTGVFTVYFAQNGEMCREILSAYLPKMESMMDDDGSLSLIRIFLNNIFASALSIGLGLAPFLFLPAFSILSNTMLIGAVLGLSAASSAVPVIKMVAVGLLPHGIFELPALFLSMAMGLYLCRLLTLKILGKAREEKILENLNALAKTFVLVVLPLLAAAAAVECFVTPALMGWAGL